MKPTLTPLTGLRARCAAGVTGQTPADYENWANGLTRFALLDLYKNGTIDGRKLMRRYYASQDLS